MLSKQFVTSLDKAFVKLYQDSKVLLVVIQPHTNLVLEKLTLLRKCVVSAKCICYKMWEKNIASFKRLDKANLFFRQFYIQAKKMKLLSLQGDDFTKIKNIETVPDWYLILIVQMSIWNGQIYTHFFGDSAWRTS